MLIGPNLSLQNNVNCNQQVGFKNRAASAAIGAVDAFVPQSTAAIRKARVAINSDQPNGALDKAVEEGVTIVKKLLGKK